MYVRVGADSSPPSFGKVSNHLNSDLSVQSETITPVTNTYLETITATAKRSGNVVSVGGSAHTKASIPVDANFLFATISAPPSFNIAVMCDRIDGSHIGARVSCQTSGNINLRTTTTIPSGVWITFSGTYVCN